MAVNIAERNGNKDEFYRRMGENWMNNLRVAMPGIIQSFDAVKQTVSVKPAIREKLRNLDLSTSWVDIPIIPDVPIVIPRAGGFALTFPVTSGDECLIIFADMCIDAWWANGDIQNQIEKRRHDLSDAFAIIGTWSQPNVIKNYSANSVQIRTIESDTSKGAGYIDLSYNEGTRKSTITLNANYINQVQRG